VARRWSDSARTSSRMRCNPIADLIQHFAFLTSQLDRFVRMAPVIT
jgi:hypothetical protein